MKCLGGKFHGEWQVFTHWAASRHSDGYAERQENNNWLVNPGSGCKLRGYHSFAFVGKGRGKEIWEEDIS